MLARLYCFVFFAFYEAQSAQGQTEVAQMVKAMTDLGIKVMQDGNIMENKIYSPIGIGFMMGMLNAGAKQETKSQIGKYVFNGLPDQFINEYMKAIIQTYSQKFNPSTAYNMSYANRIYVQTKNPILQDYQKVLSSYYLTDVKLIDFSNAESARKEINNWIEDETSQNIKDVFPENSLSNAVLVLLDAIYYKGTWQNKFNESETMKKDFFTTENDKVAVDMMSQQNMQNYYFEDDQVQVLGLPFVTEKNRDIVMYIILPTNRFGLDEVVSNMTTEYFQQLIKNGHQRAIKKLDLPKFKLESAFKANELFKKVGMIDMFDSDKADFSGINGGKDLFVSDITHKLAFGINEEGAYVATSGGVLSTRRTLESPVTFLVDQPFIFALVDRPSSTIFFMGRLVKMQ